MGFLKDLIGLTVATTVGGVIDSKLSERKQKREKANLESLEQLKELLDSGAITKKEYKKKKKEILSRR